MQRRRETSAMRVRPLDWQPAAAVPRPGADEVHLWAIDLDRHAGLRETLAATLSSDEQARARRYRRPLDGVRFAVGRGALRHLLAGYLGTSPRALAFVYNRYGKPALDRNGANAPLDFNLAHAGGRALVAVAGAGAVGVDLEAVTADFPVEPLAARVFSPAERAALAAYPAAARRAAFYRGWTRKEALLKALGRGLTGAPQDLTVSLEAEENPQPVQVSGDGARDWSLIGLAAGENYAAALAVEGRIGAVRFV